MGSVIKTPVIPVLLWLLVSFPAARQLQVPSVYSTINTAIDSAAPGDTVAVAGGTYTEHIILDRDSLTLLGGFETDTWTRDIEVYPTVLNGSGSGDGLLVSHADAFFVDGMQFVNCTNGIRIDLDSVPAPQNVSIFLTDDFEGGTAAWQSVDVSGTATSWQRISSHPHVSPSAWSGSWSWWIGGADGYYRNNTNDILTLAQPVDLSGSAAPRLRFRQYLDKDPSDLTVVDVSPDGGAHWDLAVGTSGAAPSWKLMEISLEAYAGLPDVRIRFRFISDAYNPRAYTGWFIDDIEVVNAGSQTDVYMYGFETGDEGCIHGVVKGADTWVRTGARSASGSYSYHAAEGIDSWSYLQTPVMDFSGLTAPTLEFSHWFQFALGYQSSLWSNGGMVEITTDTGVPDRDWVKLYPAGGYPAACNLAPYGNPLGNPSVTGDADAEGFYGFQTSFNKAVFDLSAYAGQSTVSIRFSCGSDVIGWGYENWYVDDIAVRDAGNWSTLYGNDMETDDGAFTGAKTAAGTWWRTSSPVFPQTDGITTAFSGDSALYCGNQASQNGNGTYDHADNGEMLINNAVVSPCISVTGTGPNDVFILSFRERRRASTENVRFITEVRADAGAWQQLRIDSASTFGNNRTGNWEQRTVPVGTFLAADSLRFRFRAVTMEGFSHIYWYVDDVQVTATRQYNGTVGYATVRDNQTGILVSHAAGVNLVNCTVVQNVVCGIRYADAGGLVDRCIVWNNGDDLDSARAVNSDISDGDAGEGNIAAEPLFADAAANDFYLMRGSPALGMGAWGRYPAVFLVDDFLAAISALPEAAFTKQNYQAALLRELGWIRDDVADGSYTAAAADLQANVLIHLDSLEIKKEEEYLVEAYRPPIYEEGLALAAVLEEEAGGVAAQSQLPDVKNLKKTTASASPVRMDRHAGERLSCSGNPVAGHTVISFILSEDRNARIGIYRPDGTAVCLGTVRGSSTGRGLFTWDGRNQEGRTVASGMYAVVVSLPDGACLTTLLQVVR